MRRMSQHRRGSKPEEVWCCYGLAGLLGISESLTIHTSSLMLDIDAVHGAGWEAQPESTAALLIDLESRLWLYSDEETLDSH